MQVTVLDAIHVIDGNDPGKGQVTLAPGTYQIERIENPYGHTYSPWWALAGTRQGITQAAWKEHQDKGHIRISGA